MGTFHLVVNFSGQAFGSLKVITPSRLGPRHCGQSWAKRPTPEMRQTTQTRTPEFLLIPPPRLSMAEVYNTCRRPFGLVAHSRFAYSRRAGGIKHHRPDPG